MSCITVKIINKSTHPLPRHATPGSAGMDLKAYINEPVVLKPMERTLVHTGLYIELPPGTEAQIRPRSGLAIKRGITVINAPGTIDQDYRGEIKIALINLSQNAFEIHDGDRIAQLVVASYIAIEWLQVEVLSTTQRGKGGHGSTGIKL